MRVKGFEGSGWRSSTKVLEPPQQSVFARSTKMKPIKADVNPTRRLPYSTLERLKQFLYHADHVFNTKAKLLEQDVRRSGRAITVHGDDRALESHKSVPAEG